MTKNPIEIPKTFMGVPIEGAMERVLSAQPQPPIPPNSSSRNIEGMIHIPQLNIYFAKERTNLNVNWNDTHSVLSSERKRIPTIEEFRQSLKYFKQSQDIELQALYNEITEVKTPWRANHLDAYFEKRPDGLYILTKNKTKAEKLEGCLMTDKTPGIDINSWVSGTKSNSQGLPKSDIEEGRLYYWHPRENRVAWFDAGSVRAGLGCGRDPVYSDSDLGVFAVTDVS